MVPWPNSNLTNVLPVSPCLEIGPGGKPGLEGSEVLGQMGIKMKHMETMRLYPQRKAL